MSTNENHSEIQDELLENKKDLLNKLSTIFDPETANNFVSPKPFETRKHLTVEDLKHVDYEQSEKRFQRLRSMVHYQTTTQSLSRADLEASYQAFVRNQIGQQQSRDQLEQFVRNSEDIDVAKRYIDSSHDVSSYPLQSHLLFHSAKLNEQRANLLKSAGTRKSLKQLNDDFTLNEYFPEQTITHSKSASKKKEIVTNKSTYSDPRSMHLAHRDKKYRITFLKDSNALQCFPKLTHYSTNNHKLHLINPRNTESLFDTDSSTVYGVSSESKSSITQREIFPALSLAALKEYRPTLTAKSSSASTMYSQKQHQRQKTDFIWEQSIVSPRHE